MRLSSAVTRLAEGVNEVVGHPIAFLLATIQTIAWTALVILHPQLDPHGFWFLYTATAISYVTQFTLTLVGLSSKKEAKRAAEESRRTLEAGLATMRTVHELVGTVKTMVGEIGEQVSEVDREIDQQLEELNERLDDRLLLP